MQMGKASTPDMGLRLGAGSHTVTLMLLLTPL